MKKTILIKLFMASLILMSSTFASALEITSHEDINGKIITQSVSGLSVDDYLKNQLGFSVGINESFGGKKIYELIKLGGRYEDKPYWYMPYLRSVNHFHDPITDKGFSGFFYGLVLSGESSVMWASKPIGMQSPGGYYSWHDVRDYFYKALTATDKTNGDKNFADTFRGLGQLMHLMQDASVPAHTRNDGHVFYMGGLA